ncbi:MAG: HEAT repeat domain-containing protein [Polyangiaceae bacterium]
MLPAAAFAASVDELTKQLSSDDFRVRTQAALALGASNDKAAIKPLCGAIRDSNQAVRMAVVAALGKLGREEGAACLRTAKGKEDDAKVKAAIDKAIEKIALGGDPPPIGSSSKFYVAIEVANKSNRDNLEVEGIVRRAMQEKLLGMSGYAVAPRGETTQQATDAMKSKKVKGFVLQASVEPFNYANGNLTVQIKVAMSTYPDRSIKATLSPKLTQQGTTKPDPTSEKELLVLASQSAVDSFVKVAASL